MASSQPTLLHSSNISDIESSCQTFNITPEQFATLKSRSASAKSTAYCPYSNFRVGATILTHEGVFIDGANVENAAYPVGTCAERVAFGKASTGKPCGMCRQFIREFCDLDTPIFMFDKNGDFIVLRLEQLLPLSFGPEALPPRENLG
ncbi:hypothetical protein DID88_006772 [Monilinia fructigena]|uniref:CMP/dCMP-type deaminase domain-containing protein n=1 Tax=Monilinia fructigena TaxID=38457 RepID=A0A395IFI9_9HELO|nr:hypothetical protein DID88_006772 [Monilinia fructigena]